MLVEELLLLLDEKYPDEFPTNLKSYDEYLIRRGNYEVLKYIKSIIDFNSHNQTKVNKSKR